MVEESATKNREAEAREEFKGVTKRLVKHDALKESIEDLVKVP